MLLQTIGTTFFNSSAMPCMQNIQYFNWILQGTRDIPQAQTCSLHPAVEDHY